MIGYLKWWSWIRSTCDRFNLSKPTLLFKDYCRKFTELNEKTLYIHILFINYDTWNYYYFIHNLKYEITITTNSYER